MAERDSFYARDASHFIVFPRASHLVASGLMASLAVLWTAALAPPLYVVAVEAALAVAIIAVATMLVAAICLVADDWWAELKSRKAYAAMDVAVDNPVSPRAVQTSGQKDHLYPPAVSNEALWVVLLANRHAARSIAPKSVADMWSTVVDVGTCMPVPKNGLRPTSAAVVGLIPEEERTDTVGGPAVAEVASGRVVIAAKHDAQEALRIRASIGLTAIRSRPWQRKGMGVNRSADRTQLAANDGPWAGSPGSDQRSAPHTVPVRIISDIIILGQGNRRPSGGESPPCTLPGGSVPGPGASARTSVGASAGPDRRQHPRAVKNSQLEVSFDAQRQLMALAEPTRLTLLGAMPRGAGCA
jgi:hypothetical protein